MFLAEKGYEARLRARSLARAVEPQVEIPFINKYLEGDDEITEGVDKRGLRKYTVQIHDQDNKGIRVVRGGWTKPLIP